MERNVKLGVAIFTILIIIMLMGSLFLFVKYGDVNKSTHSDKNVIKKVLYVTASDRSDNLVNTNFIIIEVYYNNNKTEYNIVYDGITSTIKNIYEEAEFMTHITNFSLYLLNYGGNYYTNMLVYTGGQSMDMIVDDIGELNITQLPSINNNEYLLNVTSVNGQYRQFGYCVKYSFNYLNISSKYEKIISPKRLNNEYPDVCFYTSITLIENMSTIISIPYTVITPLNIYDSLELIFFDSNRNYKNEYIIEDEMGNDIGGLDYRFTL